MYCINCGNRIENKNDNFCSNCGVMLDKDYEEEIVVRSNNNDDKDISIIFGTFAIVGSLMIIFAPFCFIISLIGIIMGLMLFKRERNISGILLSFVGLVMSILGSILLLFIVGSIFDNNSNDKDWYEDYYEDYGHYPYEAYKGEKF